MSAAHSPIGSFEILKALGSGAHSSILHVRRKKDAREYALKVVPVGGKDELKFLEQARHEYRVGSMLGHPHLIKVYCLEEVKNWLFQVKKAHLLIEYVNGKPLDEVPPVPVLKLLPLLCQTAAALVHMHRRGVFHGDLKPNNLMLGKAGIKVIDFGLATIKGEPRDRVQGTPEYMAPETARKRIVNEQTDLFNFGATMYRLTTLKLPPCAIPTGETGSFGEKSYGKLLTSAGEINKSIPPDLVEIIHHCLAFKPEKRPGRALEVLEALRAVADRLGVDHDGGREEE